MVTQQALLGPIQLKETEKGKSEKTSAQVLSNTTYDSRLYPNYATLSYPCIREIRKDPTVRLAKLAVLSPMIHTPWTFKKNKKGSQEMIDFLDECFQPLRDQFLLDACFGTLDFGWNPFEVVFKPEDGYIWIHDFKRLLHDFTTILIYLDTGGFAGYVQEVLWSSDTPVMVERKYACNTNFDVEGSDWYGTSVYQYLRPTINSWNAVEYTASKYDKKIAGASWVIYYPVGRTKWNGVETDNDQIAKNLLQSLEASGTIAIPDDIQPYHDDSIDREMKGAWRVELISAPNSSDPGFVARAKYLDALKIRGFGLTERSVLEGSHGTKAEADVHGDVSLSNVDTNHRLLIKCLNNSAVPEVLSLNFGKKYAYAAWIEAAPLVDTQFATLKDIYTRIVSDGDGLAAEAQSINMKAMRDELGIPSALNESEGLHVEKKEPAVPRIGQSSTKKVGENSDG